MSEYHEQKAVLDWWWKSHPKLYTCLFSSANGAQLAGNSATRGKQVNAMKATGFLTGVPDLNLIIAKGDYHGLFIEMKDKRRTRCSVSEPQWEFIHIAREQGYAATWCAGAEEAIQVITDYLNGNYVETKS